MVRMLKRTNVGRVHLVVLVMSTCFLMKVHLLHLSRSESTLAQRVRDRVGKPAENFSAGCSWTPGWVWDFNKEGHREVLRKLVAERMCPTILVMEEMPDWLLSIVFTEALSYTHLTLPTNR